MPNDSPRSLARSIAPSTSGSTQASPVREHFDVARFYPNPKRKRGILLRSPQSENPPRRLIERHGRERKSTVQMVSSAIPR